MKLTKKQVDKIIVALYLRDFDKTKVKEEEKNIDKRFIKLIQDILK